MKVIFVGLLLFYGWDDNVNDAVNRNVNNDTMNIW